MVLFTGPAGAGKSTLTGAWCATRLRAAHIELDKVRHLIVSGLTDPQVPGPLQAEQYGTSGITVTPVSNPEMPSASRRNTRSATPTMASGLP